MVVHIESREAAEQLVDAYDNFLFDCDGVIWLDEAGVAGVRETIEHLLQLGKQVAYVTNNSSRSREYYLKKFARLGFKNVSKDRIFPTSYAAAVHLQRELAIAEGSKIWVLGDHGIEEELQELNYVPVGGTDTGLDSSFDEKSPLLVPDPEVKAVVVGSTKDINYMRIALTLQYLLDDKMPFVGTNIDRVYPGPRGLILPAGGSVVNFMEYTSHRDCINVGKPSRILLDDILGLCGFDRERTLMVGDTLYTDIKFGNDGELGGGNGSSLLVLTGQTKRHTLNLFLETPNSGVFNETMIPLFVIESFGDIIKFLQ